jgi:hypothetical protein
MIDPSLYVHQSRRTQASSSWSQGQDVSGAAFIELRVRIIQWEAATLGKRVISTAAIGILLFVFAMVRPSSLAFRASIAASLE